MLQKPYCTETLCLTAFVLARYSATSLVLAGVAGEALLKGHPLVAAFGVAVLVRTSCVLASVVKNMRTMRQTNKAYAATVQSGSYEIHCAD